MLLPPRFFLKTLCVFFRTISNSGTLLRFWVRSLAVDWYHLKKRKCDSCLTLDWAFTCHPPPTGMKYVKVTAFGMERDIDFKLDSSGLLVVVPCEFQQP